MALNTNENSPKNEAAQVKASIKRELEGHDPFHLVYLDDDALLLRVYADRLETLGFQVFSTTSAEEAIQYIEQNKTRLAAIISDYQMPGLNGFQFRERILQSPAAMQIPFIILSGFIDKEMALQGLSLKISGFADKSKATELLQLLALEALPRVQAIKEDRDLMKGFISESEEVIERAEGLIMSLDQNPKDQDTLNHFFGLVHTLKGASSFFEPKSMHRFAHRFEEVLKQLQRNELVVDDKMVSKLFSAMDQIKNLLPDFKSAQHREFDLEAAFDKIFNVNAPQAQVGAQSASGKEQTSKDKQGAPVGTVQPAEIKVPITMLDEFMHISGEMTVIRNMLNKCVRSIEKQYSGDKEISVLVELLDELHKVNGGVQSKISEMRKVSVRSVLKPIPRAVREVAKALGKEVDLKLDGIELRIDTAIAEVLSNSLLHIVKNSIDHGLETAEQRTSAGKAATGSILISSRIQNEQVVVEIQDDGRGLNVLAIREKLVRNGSHTKEEAELLPPETLYSMIFEPGFSTAKQVTDISGRGVGMSLVKSVVESVSGKIQIQSEQGKGSKFTLTLPVPRSVLITNCLFVKSGSDQFGILEGDVIRVLRVESVDDERIQKFAGGSALHASGELIPIVHLEALLSDGRSVSSLPGETEACFSLVLVQTSSSPQKVAIRVNEILDVEDTVIKALPFQINPNRLYQGATFLDDGSIGLILNSTAIVERMNSRSTQLRNSFPAPVENKEAKFMRVLLLEIDGLGLCALLANDVHRIEEISAQTLGSKSEIDRQPRLVAYRGKALTMLPVFELLHGLQKPAAPRAQLLEGPVPVVVLEREQKFFGIRTNQVLEIADIELAVSELRDAGVLCRGFYENRIVTVLDLEYLLNLFVRPKVAIA